MKIGEQIIVFLAVNKNGDEIILDNTPLGKERYGRMRDRRMTMSIFPSRIIIRRSYSQKVLSVD